MFTRKIVISAAAAVIAASAFTGCGNADSGSASDFKSNQTINVISREDGSGTRGAFIELFGVEQKNEAGEKVDYTTDSATVTSSTGVMMTSVSQDKYAVGYISLGSLNDTVSSVKIDGVEATIDNIKSGDYKIARPFNIAVKDGLSEESQDFIDFIMSADGQAVVEASGYITVSDAPAYSGTKRSGKVTVAGSSSVTPVMEKLKEAYNKVNPDVKIEINQSDSTTGMSSAADGICDIGMASRELKDSELEKSLTSTVIAMDGITVIVSNDNPVAELTTEQVKGIYTGEITTWESLIEK